MFWAVLGAVTAVTFLSVVNSFVLGVEVEVKADAVVGVGVEAEIEVEVRAGEREGTVGVFRRCGGMYTLGAGLIEGAGVGAW